MPLISFYTPSKNQKPGVLSYFQGVQKENSGMKQIKWNRLKITIEKFN